MIDIKRATELIRQHFAELTPEQFIENLKQSCPEVFEDDLKKEVIISDNDNGTLATIPYFLKKPLDLNRGFRLNLVFLFS